MISKSSKFLTSLILLLPATLLSAAPAVSPTASAADSQTLAGALAAMQGNLTNLNQQAGDLQGQISEVGGTITRLQTEYNALLPVLSQKQALLKESIKESYVTGEPSSLEVIASNQTFSGVVGQQHYQDEISGKTKTAADQLQETKKQINGKLSEAKQKQDGLVALKGQFDEKVGTAQSQVQAQQALLTATQGKEEEFQRIRQQEKTEEAAAIVASTTPASAAPAASAAPSPAATPSNSGGAISSSHGGNPYPYGQCTWYVYDQTGRGQNGNAGSWSASSSTPGVGKIMIWRPGQQGASGAGHVGVVIGVSGNTVTIRHMNWNGWGVVSTGTFQSTGAFY